MYDFTVRGLQRGGIIVLVLLLSGCSLLPPAWLAQRARSQALNFDFQAALTDINAALAQDPTNPRYYTIRGEIYLYLYEWNNAKADFDAALHHDPTYAEAYFQRGVLYYTMIERRLALADFQQYLVLSPDGHYAAQARQYVASLPIEIEASGG
jgi:tetratricopeptide (TPR) repeat protein